MGNAITSGSVYPLSIFEKVGLFRDDFFIDAIDTEFNYRLRTHKYNIWGVGSISMRHKLGNKTTFKLFFFHFRNVNYPPIRIYYVLRNHTIVNRLYPHYFDAFNFYRFFLFRRLCQVLLYEPDKRKKLKAMFYGLIHGWKGKTGVCTIFE